MAQLKGGKRREGRGEEDLGGGVMTKTNGSRDHIPPFILSFPWRSIVTPFIGWQTFSIAGHKPFIR